MNPTPKKGYVEPLVLIAGIVIFIVGLASFGWSAYKGNGQEDIVQNCIICAVGILIPTLTYLGNKYLRE